MLFLSLSTLMSLPTAKGIPQQDEVSSYGIDVSWPMQSREVSDRYAWLDEEASMSNKNSSIPITNLPDRNKVYSDYIRGCIEMYDLGKPGSTCQANEEERIAMNLRQPQAVKNYTDTGFKKIKAPKDLMDMLINFWNINKESRYPEAWPVGNIYTNHWESPTHMVSVENATLAGAGPALKQRLWDAARDSLEEWTGQKLKESSLYGIRVYEKDSILSTHVDRMPLISSCIINVDQDVDEDWPIEVIGHDGKAHNITMEPGDMVLYESHSILHGRPFALKGRHYANVFIHFEPLVPIEQSNEDHPDDLPPYIQEGTVEAVKWRRHNPKYSHKVIKTDFLEVSWRCPRFLIHYFY